MKLHGLVAEHDAVVEHFAELLIDGEKVGFVTTPAYSKRMGQSQVLVHVIPAAAEPGTRVPFQPMPRLAGNWKLIE